MYQYVAILKSSQETIAEGHNLTDLEKEVVRIAHKRSTSDVKDIIIYYHNKRNRLTGKYKKKLIKEQPF